MSVLVGMISNMDAGLTILRQEFDAEEGSFLLRLRCDLHWDRAAFRRLERAMRLVCEQNQAATQLDRWVAEGFHSVPSWVADWTAHPQFPRPEPDRYYRACIERLSDLATWYFQGYHDHLEPHSWAEL
ncbi:hypothetical protein CFP65_3886 [Kitasatospora sp. MMS16-BH015]|uniref:hypothetical protein n=1 Tax=Kitasatospora sp. MMS16-BH015 TaxID=2018025 RepID=UPI000CA32E82|nr:hypothetical protein [Kitasatospora sp. MMS16-BH015]AUG78661.1 hypothetical protein CFP65_3886 [Kitasatospora sp. MMS16-BH015]